MKKQLYRYQADVKKVVDGDTIICLVDLGFKTFSLRIVRLAGINAPEINTKDDGERARAISAKKYLTGLLSLDRLSIEFLSIYLESKALHKYGRSIGTIYLDLSTDKSINQMMLDSGNAVEYKTH